MQAPGKDDDAPVSVPPSVTAAEPPPAVEQPMPLEEIETKSPAETAEAAAIQKGVTKLQQRIAEMDNAEALARQAAQPSPPPQPPTTEQIIAGSGLPPKFQNWLRQHPDYINDPTKNEQ